MNWVDLIIILVFLIYVIDGYRRGFLQLCWELFGLLFSFALALKFYYSLSNLLIDSTQLTVLDARSIAFALIWGTTQIIFYIIGRLIIKYVPFLKKDSEINHYFGLLPAAIKGIIFIAVLLVLIIISPISQKIKNSINNSITGKLMINSVAKYENKISRIFSPNDNSLTSLTTVQMDKDSKLNFQTTDISIDEIGEDILFSKTNEERAKVNLPPLKQDVLLKNTARAHTRDMAIKGYFSHNSPTGQNLLLRLTDAKVNFTIAAENIAIAPTVDLAQIGLMNSPDHRVNILDPNFTRIGIGIVRAGNHGLLVTEDFAK